VEPHEPTIHRFDSADVASRYPAAYERSFRAAREVRSIKACLSHVAAGSRVLDLPCGTGRLLPLLVEAGFQVTAADSSAHMLERAQAAWQSRHGTPGGSAPSIEFKQCDVMHTGFADAAFGGVVCNRLFHHFAEPATRVAALQELRRISHGPLIVSFFNSFALDAVRFKLKHKLRGTVPSDRIPIPLDEFSQDIDASGLTIITSHAVMWGLSPMWHLVLGPRGERPR
jgi:2-polyprenyl-3-methyl-5-hydroxy-6-metoxy-1,4-benzoquinol methylase